MILRTNRFSVTFLGIFFAVSTLSSWADKAPLSPEKLQKEASHIVSGKILEVTAKVQKSNVEKGIGLHRDRVFTIKIRVRSISKGAGVKAGDQIDVLAWQPSTRIPLHPGLQGHELINSQKRRRCDIPSTEKKRRGIRASFAKWDCSEEGWGLSELHEMKILIHPLIL